MKKPIKRYDESGPRVLMAQAGKWLLVRRPHGTPHAMHLNDWLALSSEPILAKGEK